MITAILPINESYRLSHQGAHQSLVLALQAEASGLIIKSTGVILEISEAALRAAILAKEEVERKKVQPVNSLAKATTDHPFKNY